MGTFDFGRAAGVSIAIMFVNVAISFAMVALYSVAVEPGRDQAFYQSAAQWIAPLSSMAFGWILFLSSSLYFSGRAGRNALGFAINTFAIYAFMDLAIIGVAGRLSEIGSTVVLSLASKFAGAVLGVWLIEQWREEQWLTRSGDRVAADPQASLGDAEIRDKLNVLGDPLLQVLLGLLATTLLVGLGVAVGAIPEP
jgi:hypothetical protein